MHVDSPKNARVGINEPDPFVGNAFAVAADVPHRRINEIVLVKLAMTADIAVRHATTLGTTLRFWVGLQADFDLEEARCAIGATVRMTERIAA